MPPPQCANGIDDNHNGLVDYGVDPGCYAANDDTEDGGTYAGAVSQNIHFVFPRIADIRGIANGGVATAFPNEQVQVDTEWLGTSATTPKGVVVVGIGADRVLRDRHRRDSRASPASTRYNYTAPALMYVCDRLISFGGTSADFYGFDEMNYPTWSLDEWDPTVRPCLVPEPTTLDPDTINGSTSTMSTLAASLVQVPQVGCSGLSKCCGGGCAGLTACCAQLPAGEVAACTASAATLSFGSCTNALAAYQSKGCIGLAPCCAALSGAEQTACLAEVKAADDGACTTSLTNYVSMGTCGTCTSGGANFPLSALEASPASTTCSKPSECASGFCTAGKCTPVISTCTDVVAADDMASCQTTLTQAQADGYCGSSTVHVSEHFGPGLVPYTTAADGTVTIASGAISADVSSCDYLGTGKLDFSDPREEACSTACTMDSECTEYSNFIANQQFTLVVVDSSGSKFTIFGDGSASASFDPITLKGQNLAAFSGNLMFFSGGAQYTITARCADDVVTGTSLPLPSSQACVVSRAIPDTTTTN